MTITRSTLRGTQEVLTKNGFKTREWIKQHNAENTILYFNNEEGSKKVKELRKDCRIKSIKRSIILNYS